MTSQTQTLLLIFRKESPDLFHLLNETGLPISTTSPLLTSQTQGKTLVVAPLLLVAVTEAIRANQDVLGGFEYLMSWAANDFRHFYVILEKRPPPAKRQDDDNANNNTNESSPWDKPDDQKFNQDWGDNNNDYNNDQNQTSGSGWGDSNNTSNDNNNNTTTNDAWGAPPASPVRDSNRNAASEFKNHEWPAGLVSANGGGGNGGGNGRGRSASETSGWDVRDWARSPSEMGGGAGTGTGGGWGTGTGATPVTTASSTKGASGW